MKLPAETLHGSTVSNDDVVTPRDAGVKTPVIGRRKERRVAVTRRGLRKIAFENTVATRSRLSTRYKVLISGWSGSQIEDKVSYCRCAHLSSTCTGDG